MVVRLIISMPNLTLWSLPKSLVSYKVLRLHRIFLYGNFSSTLNWWKNSHSRYNIFNPEKLFKVIKEKKLSIVELVPVVLRELLDYISRLSTQQRLLPNLKWMMVTGESVSVELVNQWLRMYPSIRVVNAYGPTEAADDITQFIVEKPLPENQRTVPIGKPLANLNLYILDGQMQLVPIGVPGEICVSGFGVGEGYGK